MAVIGFTALDGRPAELVVIQQPALHVREV
jgi:hypothetical protein